MRDIKDAIREKCEDLILRLLEKYNGLYWTVKHRKKKEGRSKNTEEEKKARRDERRNEREMRRFGMRRVRKIQWPVLDSKTSKIERRKKTEDRRGKQKK